MIFDIGAEIVLLGDTFPAGDPVETRCYGIR
jgi:hypothetical protein